MNTETGGGMVSPDEDLYASDLPFRISAGSQTDVSSPRDTLHSFASNANNDGHVGQMVFMADQIYTTAQRMDWLDNRSATATGAVVVIRSGTFTAVAPCQDTKATSELEDMARHLEAQAMLAMASLVIAKVVDRIPPTSRSLSLPNKEKINVYNVIEDALNHKRASKSGFMLIRDQRIALVWTSNAKQLIEAAMHYDRSLFMLLQQANNPKTKSWLFQEDGPPSYIETQRTIEVVETHVTSALLESQSMTERPTSLMWPITIGLTLLLLGLLMGKMTSVIILAIVRDHMYFHLAFLLYQPLACALSAFFVSIIVVGAFQLLGPISQVSENSSTYSGQRIARDLLPHDLPHITIQCPVFKEDLWDVLDPTFESVREAILTYELQGGTASIIVNDDGMRLMTSADADARKSYYLRKGIGWTARPEHNKDGYLRAGAFKKASNLNFGLRASLAVEAVFDSISTNLGSTSGVYASALQTIIDDSQGELLAGGDIGLGELILLIDADTRVPRDCFMDAAKEFHSCPSLAILQHASGVLQVSHDFWENGLAHFTKNNYLGTKYVVAGGDNTPFFGHNAFLKFSAMTDIADYGEDKTRWWSEEHVSEDFEMSLKLLSAGYTARMAGYSNGEFKEGVCLTVFDEINRWEKYAFGVCELMFHPVRYWLHRGPLTPLFRHFLSSSMDPSAKCSSIFYMFTYFAIGMSWPLCVVNYLLVGWYPMLLRSYYVDCLQILVSVTVIFSLKDAIVGPIVMYRLKEVPLGRGLLNAMKYFIIVSLFLQGISMHVSKCLVWHLCNLKMHWGATNKSVENDATLREDLPMIWSRYKFMYLTVAFLFMAVLALALGVPPYWRITDVKAILPLLWMLFWHAAIPLLMHNRSFLSDIYRTKTPSSKS